MQIEPKHALIIGLLGCFILACLCASFHGAAIERDLVLRTRTTLQSFRIQGLKVFANGRDIMLTGVAPDERSLHRAIVAAQNVNGVFRVISHLQAVDTKLSTGASAELSN